LADAHVADRVLARVVPVGIEGDVVGPARHLDEVLEEGADLGLAGALDERLEALVLVALTRVRLRQARHDLGDVLGRHGADREPEGARVLFPLAAEHDLEVRHGIAGDLSADTPEPEVGDVVLAAGVEAAADLDPKLTDRLVEEHAPLGEASSELGAEAA